MSGLTRKNQLFSQVFFSSQVPNQFFGSTLLPQWDLASYFQMHKCKKKHIFFSNLLIYFSCVPVQFLTATYTTLADTTRASSWCQVSALKLYMLLTEKQKSISSSHSTSSLLHIKTCRVRWKVSWIYVKNNWVCAWVAARCQFWLTGSYSDCVLALITTLAGVCGTLFYTTPEANHNYYTLAATSPTTIHPSPGCYSLPIKWNAATSSYLQIPLWPRSFKHLHRLW